MTDQAISPLRRRMIEDMTIRKISPKTQQGYIRTIKNLAAFLGRSPDTASFEDPALSAAFSHERRRHANSQSSCCGVAVLLPGHAQAVRHRRAHGIHP